MSIRKKYIIVKEDILELPILFDQYLIHNTIAGKYYNIVSGGFFEITKDNDIIVYGKSTSLNVDSRPIDANIIKQFLFQTNF